MNVIYSDKAKQGEGYALLQQATKRLEELVGQSADPVQVEWDREEDAEGQPHYTLRLSDWSGKVPASFTPKELQPSTDLQFRLYELWDDLLRIRTRKLLDNLRDSGD